VGGGARRAGEGGEGGRGGAGRGGGRGGGRAKERVYFGGVRMPPWPSQHVFMNVLGML
jgi:hypothetical protein